MILSYFVHFISTDTVMKVIHLHLFKIYICLQDFADPLSIRRSVRTWELLKMSGCNVQHICLYVTAEYMPAKYC